MCVCVCVCVCVCMSGHHLLMTLGEVCVTTNDDQRKIATVP